jgi:hypothetical protein
VDSSDPQWQQNRNHHKYRDSPHDANAEARFRDMETLKYVLRSIEKHCPWYHKIYLITTGHTPEWLDLEHPKVSIISHDKLFIDKSHLPVFSSVAIEMNLVNIKDISETFVYMNDDFVIWNRLDETRFFKDGKPLDFFAHSFIPRNRLFELLKTRDTWIHSINNTLELFNQKFAPLRLKNKYLYHPSYSFSDRINNFLFQHLFKKFIWINHWHHPQPLLKKTLEEVYDIFSSEMMECSKNRFRSNSDLNQYMYRYWQLLNGDFYPYKHNDGLIANISSLRVLEKMIETLGERSDINFVCFNDSTELKNDEYMDVKSRLTNFLETRFPEKASFEKK